MIKFKLLPFKNAVEDSALIGRTGILRIKKNLAIKLGLEKQDKWVFAIDQNNILKTDIYLIKAKSEHDYNGKRMTFISGSWTLDAKPLLAEYTLKTPINFKVELYKDNKVDGIRLLIA